MTRYNPAGKRYQINRTVPTTIVVAEFDTEAEAQKFWNEHEGDPTEYGETGQFLDMGERQPDRTEYVAPSEVVDQYA